MPEPIKLEIYKVEIPMRSFEHAAASRNVAKNILICITYSDGTQAWGESLPRDYVTGETLQTVPADIATLWEKCLQTGVLNMPTASNPTLADIPSMIGNRYVGSAAGALDVARFNSMKKLTLREMQDVLKANGLSTSKKISQKVTGVLGSANPEKTRKRLKLMHLAGLRDFKLKLGFGDEIDTQNLEIVYSKLGKKIAKNKASLRVDINGGWSIDEIISRAQELVKYNVCAIEQPIYVPAGQLVEIAESSPIPLLADESLLTYEDGKTLAKAGCKIWWNIRISKNAGILGALKLARLAEENQIPYSAGCMVGETSILSAAQRRLLQLATGARFVEGNWGKILLSEDILKSGKSLRFGYAGKLKTIKKSGLGVAVDKLAVQKLGKLLASYDA